MQNSEEVSFIDIEAQKSNKKMEDRVLVSETTPLLQQTLEERARTRNEAYENYLNERVKLDEQAKTPVRRLLDFIDSCLNWDSTFMNVAIYFVVFTAGAGYSKSDADPKYWFISVLCYVYGALGLFIDFGGAFFIVSKPFPSEAPSESRNCKRNVLRYAVILAINLQIVSGTALVWFLNEGIQITGPLGFVKFIIQFKLFQLFVIFTMRYCGYVPPLTDLERSKIMNKNFDKDLNAMRKRLMIRKAEEAKAKYISGEVRLALRERVLGIFQTVDFHQLHPNDYGSAPFVYRTKEQNEEFMKQHQERCRKLKAYLERVRYSEEALDLFQKFAASLYVDVPNKTAVLPVDDEEFQCVLHQIVAAGNERIECWERERQVMYEISKENAEAQD